MILYLYRKCVARTREIFSYVSVIYITFGFVIVFQFVGALSAQAEYGIVAKNNLAARVMNGSINLTAGVLSGMQNFLHTVSGGKIGVAAQAIDGQAIRNKNQGTSVTVQEIKSTPSSVHINAPAGFKNNVEFANGFTSQAGIVINGTLRGQGVDVGAGNITAGNVVYAITPGEGIDITGSLQRPVISSQNFWKKDNTIITTRDPEISLALEGALTIGSGTKGSLLHLVGQHATLFDSFATMTVVHNVANAWNIGSSATATPIISIDSRGEGSVGIGTISPSAKLGIKNSQLGSVAFQVQAADGQQANLVEIKDATEKSLLVFDAIGRLGIGTNSTNAALHVASTSYFGDSVTASSSVYLATNGGRVGIGTLNPKHTLSVKGTLNVTSDAWFDVSPILSTVSNCSGSGVLETDGEGRITCGQDEVGTGGAAPAKDKGEVNTGTLGALTFYRSTGNTVSGASQLFYDNTLGILGIGSTTPGSILSVQGVANFISAATSTFYQGINVPTINATSTSATSTFANGIQLSGGCFLLSNGICAGSAGSGGAVSVGTSNRVAYYSGVGSIDSANFLTLDTSNSFLGIGSTTPGSILSVQGVANFVSTGTSTIYKGIHVPTIHATSTTATSTFANGIQLSGGLKITNLTECPNLTNSGKLTTDGNGIVICSNDTGGSGTINSGTVNRLSYYSGATTLDSADLLTLYSNVNSWRLGIGTSTPYAAMGILSTSSPQFILTDFVNDPTKITHWFASTTIGNLNIGVINNLNAGTSTYLTIASTTGNIGIGTTSPSSLLSVAGNSYFAGIGGFGYGTATSSHVLLDSNLITLGSSSASNLTVAYQRGATTTIPVNTKYAFTIATGTMALFPIFAIDSDNASSTFQGNINVASSTGTSTFQGGVLAALSGGNVGIGDATPAALLTVGAGDLFQVTSTGLVRGPLGAVGTPTYSFVGDTNTGMWSSGADTLNFSTAGSEAMRIDSSGSVGIGTTPIVGFDVNKLSFNIHNGSAGYISGTGGTVAIGSDGSSASMLGVNGGVSIGSTYFSTNAAPANGLLVQGNVGIGSTTPASRFSVTGDTYLDSSNIIIGSSTAINISKLTLNFQNVATTVLATSSVNAFSFARSLTGVPLLSLDTLNTRIGIASTSPGSLFSVQEGNAQITGTTTSHAFVATSTLFVGAQGQLFNVMQSGFVGIGTTSPSSLLSIAGNSYFAGIGGFGYGTATSSHVLFDTNLFQFGSSSAATLTINYARAATTTIPNNTGFAFTIATSTGQAQGSSTTTPIFAISTNGNVATSSFYGGVSIADGAFEYGGISGVTSIDAFNVGSVSFDTDAGQIAWTDLPIATSTGGIHESYSAMIGGIPILTVYGMTASGTVATTSVGIGTTTPAWLLQIASTSPFFAISDDDAPTRLKHWTVSNQNGNLYMATATDLTGYGTSTVPALLVASTSQVGIGTSSPQARLAVNGNVSLFLNGTVTTNGVCHTGGNIDAADLDVGRQLVACSGAPADIAEWYATEQDVESADIVAIGSSIIEYQAQGADAVQGTIKTLGRQRMSVLKKAISGDVALGIVSTAPFQTFGSDIRAYSSTTQPVALSGRVTVKVSDEHGAIKAGDRITLSSLAGIGAKAHTGDDTVGIALEDIDFSGATIITTPNGKTVYKSQALVLVNLSPRTLSSSLASLASGSSNIWGVDSSTGRVFFGAGAGISLDLASADIIHVGQILSDNGSWSIARDGTLSVKKIITDETETGSLNVGSSEKPTGITLFDEQTGNPYCVKIRGGAMVSEAGACSISQINSSQGSSMQVRSEDISPSPTPSPSPTLPEDPASTPLPSPSSGVSPDPIPSSTPESSPAPDPVISDSNTVNDISPPDEVLLFDPAQIMVPPGS